MQELGLKRLGHPPIMPDLQPCRRIGAGGPEAGVSTSTNVGCPHHRAEPGLFARKHAYVPAAPSSVGWPVEPPLSGSPVSSRSSAPGGVSAGAGSAGRASAAGVSATGGSPGGVLPTRAASAGVSARACLAGRRSETRMTAKKAASASAASPAICAPAASDPDDNLARPGRRRRAGDRRRRGARGDRQGTCYSHGKHGACSGCGQLRTERWGQAHVRSRPRSSLLPDGSPGRRAGLLTPSDHHFRMPYSNIRPPRGYGKMSSRLTPGRHANDLPAGESETVTASLV